MLISPFWAILVPACGGGLIALVKEHQARARNALAVIIALITFLIVAPALPVVLQGETITWTAVQITQGLSISFAVEPLGVLFAVLASLLWVFAAIYATGYMGHEYHCRRFFTFYILALSATMGVAFSANLFTMYLFYEYLALITYPLVIHAQTREAYAAGTKYIIYCFVSGAMVFLTMFIFGGIGESLTFSTAGIFGSVLESHALTLWIMFFIAVMGFGVKAAIMPLHSWLPSAMVAPTPVSALLHAVAIVKTGIFGILRVMFYLYGVEALQYLGVTNILAAIVVLTIIIASVLAIRQEKLKSRLAYSTIGQLGYITLGAAMLSPYGLTGGIVHIINHAFLKIVLFFCAGAIITQTGAKYLEQLNGIGKRMPYTMFFFSLASIGLIGVLPLAGYVSKLYLLGGSIESGLPILGFVLLTSAILNSIYYFPIIIRAYFSEGSYSAPQGLESPPAMFIPTAVLTVMCFVFGFYAQQTTLPLVNLIVASIFQ
ncbi:complex I subunit 5 family protein [Dethiobacter alkaliphilus]|uniref:NADH dehydrogenase (Quinone) n=1 Tax=Dethiobacter alkaliphilus AHT 1 TaxID=555088 RepID=C0GJ38_DETAL|nr:proton-conducting transporter membrane subunit [Dethiobacter alkaliphilus]EEG76671.1 NADH dehydrogenase (quinone) [Dethiobacter alkaliphilus AHT 1]